MIVNEFYKIWKEGSYTWAVCGSKSQTRPNYSAKDPTIELHEESESPALHKLD